MRSVGIRAARIGLVSILFGLSCFAAENAGFELVTAEEYQRESPPNRRLSVSPTGR